ncbi:MAG: putative serine protease HtrA [Microgenomates group bacterium ADurb.Bin219]|nr:MAG: putative serine protease HtrA [Microgenomates group bacterium ADurb.Bin219]HNP89334.1 trypsin-like peptidase domain-containing protein [Candidatus Woesebacteria bacterium]
MKKNSKSKKILTVLALALVIAVSSLGGAISDRLFGYRLLDRYFKRQNTGGESVVERKIVSEESVVIDAVEKASPSVVTIGISKTQTLVDPFEDFFDPFGFFNYPRRNQRQPKEVEQNIATGFIVSKEGLIVTNKHVVSETEAKYKVLLNDKKEYEVKKIYRDPTNDLAILKVDSPAEGFPTLELGDSEKLKVGQLVIAIGTPLGEFPNSVTRGIISGLGRGISAGSVFEGFVEQLDNVIQTDAAINPGNSGGPLLNSAGQVIGVNVAMASGAQNIGFAIPINVVKEMIENFNKTGQFSRPFLGIRYRMISQKEAVSKNWVEGAGVVEVIEDSPAEKAGIEVGDIITKIDNRKLTEKDAELAKIISSKKVGDRLSIVVWRDEEEKTLTVTLEESR